MNLDDLESLLRAATPRPWKHFTSVSRTGMHLGDGILFPEGSKRRELVYLNGDEKTPDLVLVVALRNLAPELIAVARAAEEYVEAQTADGMFLMDAVRRHAERKEALDAALAALRAKIGEAT